MRHRLVTSLVAVAVAVAVPACTSVSSPAVSSPAVSSPAGAVTAPAASPLASDVLAGLPVKGRAPTTGYRRDRYGEGWADQDGDGCSTREEILRRDLTRTTYQRSGRCLVIDTGVLADPYTGQVVTFRRGTSTSGAVQIDHVVALADSWQKGAQRLSAARRAQFANDPLNLLAVDGAANQAKGAADAASWLPSNRSYRCAYVARQVAVKARYGLWVTTAEKDAISRVLATCPSQRTPAP